MSLSRRKLILDSVGDLALNFVVYDRKEDEDLPRGEIEDAIDLGEVTLEEILDAFKGRFLKERRQPRVFLHTSLGLRAGSRHPPGPWVRPQASSPSTRRPTFAVALP